MYSSVEVSVYFYNKKAHAFDRIWRKYNECTYRLLRGLLKHLKNKPQHILDVGCGTGNVLRILHQYFPSADLTGIDPSSAMLEQINIKVSQAHLIKGDIFTQTKGQFDLITSVSMFHYIDNPEDWISHAFNLLNPQGMLLLIDWNGSAPIMRIRKWRLERMSHIKHVYGKKEICDLLKNWKQIASADSSCFVGWWSVQGHLVMK